MDAVPLADDPPPRRRGAEPGEDADGDPAKRTRHATGKPDAPQADRGDFALNADCGHGDGQRGTGKTYRGGGLRRPALLSFCFRLLSFLR